MKKEERPWSVPADDIYKLLDSSDKGLTSSEAQKRLSEQGANEVAKKTRRHASRILLSQFSSPLIFILIIAALVSFFLGERTEAVVIIAIVMLNSMLGFFQEYKAEKALRELRKYVTHQSNVLRDGKVVELDSKDIVLGDVLFLHKGDIVPADIRLIEAKGLSIDESSLTGESVPIKKSTSIIDAKYSLPQDLKNMVMTGTVIVGGSAQGIVTATGSDTFLGKTAESIKEITKEGDFQKSISKFSNLLLKIILVMTLLIFAVNAFLDRGILMSFIFAVALAVGITPELLPIIITITLSNGAVRMAKEKVITKRLSSIEDFGNIDVLCSDKTGTLTEGNMKLHKFVDLRGKNSPKVLLYSMLCSSIKKQKRSLSFEDPIDRAIWQSREAGRLEQKYNSYKILAENDFEFERRRMSVLLRKGKNNIIIVKGAAESILKVCNSINMEGKIKKLSREGLLEINNKISGYEQDGYNMVAVAEKKTDKNKCEVSDEKNLTLIGFLLFIDPPKKNVKKSLEMLERLGIQVKIISGDSPVITKRICKEVNIELFGDKVITGEELDSLNEEKFIEYSNRYNVFARVSPEQKYRIVNSIRKKGHIVGFLGDGVNDAPALNAADVGISVNTATGIAKESADFILLRKSLRVLAHGIIEGRKTFNNIMKYILNTISANFGNMFTVAASSFFLKFIPLLPSQILLNNFLSDVPLLAISTDNVDEENLKKPRHWNFNLISNFMFIFGLISSIFDMLLIISLMFFIHATTEQFRTSWFILSALSEIIITFAIRTKSKFYKSKSSGLLVWLSILTIFVTVGITYLTIGSKLFSFTPLSLQFILLIAGILILYFTVIEIVKKHFFSRFEA